MAAKWKEIRALYKDLNDAKWSAVDAVFWFGLGVATCVLMQILT